MYHKYSHCSYCGEPFAADQPWPRRCIQCGNVSYVNPLPVAVVLLPVDDGLLAVRRTIPPGKDQLALPGGFIDYRESWQAAGVREVYEETGISLDSRALSVFDVHSAPDSTLLIFGLATPIRAADLPAFVASGETSERVVLHEAVELAFSLHTEAVKQYFDRRRVQH